MDREAFDKLDRQSRETEKRARSLLDRAGALVRRVEAVELRSLAAIEKLAEAGAALALVSPSREELAERLKERFDERFTKTTDEIEKLSGELDALPGRVRAVGSPARQAALSENIGASHKRWEQACRELVSYVKNDLVTDVFEARLADIEGKVEEIIERADDRLAAVAERFSAWVDDLEAAAETVGDRQKDWLQGREANWEAHAQAMSDNARNISQRLDEQAEGVVARLQANVESVLRAVEALSTLRQGLATATQSSGGALTVITGIITDIKAIFEAVK